MIRAATPNDMPAIMGMARRFHALSPWSGVPFDDEAVIATVGQLLGMTTAAVFVADRGPGATGMAAVMISPVFFGTAHVAQEVFWYCESPRDSEGLLLEIEGWAAQKGAYALSVARLEGLRDKALDRKYRRRGYSPNEHFYMKVL